uniref:Pectin acetylesterase n=1 Tax=Brassica oleracea TaxID=3712 RepID=A0A3P6E185_BRAOL|nr:unnamed protein product [Brassica oleracea]
MDRYAKWKQRELLVILFYAVAFYAYALRISLRLSHDHYLKLRGLAPGWLIPSRRNDVSDAQWRNFRGNLPILSFVFAVFTVIANGSRSLFKLKAKGMTILWLFLSLVYLTYLHGACVIFILSIATANFLLVKVFARKKFFPFMLWAFNLFFLLCNRIYEGYSFSIFGPQFEYLDNFRGTFRWHICFNFVVLRMISFGYDYHWGQLDSHFDLEKHVTRCSLCKLGKTCYVVRQEKDIASDSSCSFSLYLCYLVYAPLYLAGPIISFNAFASQLDVPQNTHSVKDVARYGLRWLFSFLLMELMTQFFYYNAFVISGLWRELSPVEIFIIGYGVLNFMWLKFLLLWRYFRFWSLVNGIETVENMPNCINNCYSLETFWKTWHASFNRWLIRYMYIPLGGSRRKFLNVWVVFTFVAVWHDLEWKLLSWAWLTCLFFMPEMLLKSASNAIKVQSAFGEFLLRELKALSGAVTITCLMMANLAGYVIGPSGLSLFVSSFLSKEGLPVLGGVFFSFYVGTKLMFHIKDLRSGVHRPSSETPCVSSEMKKLLLSLTLFGLTLLILPVNGIMEFDEMEWFTSFNGTKVFKTESDVYSEAKFPMVGLTLIQSAAAKGAVCLDGSLPGYHLHRGFGSGAKNWLVQLEGGGWCDTIRNCVYRKTSRRGSSKYMEKNMPFTGILSDKAAENPDFYNWNRVKVRYCDGGSFSGDSENKAAQLQFRGKRIWLAAMEDLMAKGMRQSKQALLSGCSAGGLAAILRCDDFGDMFSPSTRVKCLSDAGFFLDAIDVSGGRSLRRLYAGVVKLQNLETKLSKDCLNRLNPTSCFFPQNLISQIKTPLFILNAAYDSWQIQESLAPKSADPSGSWHDCRLDYTKCNSTQIQFLQGFRTRMVNLIKGFAKPSKNGVFLNSCFAHCQTERHDTWYSQNSPAVNKKARKIFAVGDWYFERGGAKLIDCAYPCDKTCHNLVFRG